MQIQKKYQVNMNILFLTILFFQVSAQQRIGAPSSEVVNMEPDGVLVVDEAHVHRKLQTAKNVGNNGQPSSVYPLKVCQGDCDKDSDCTGSLKCFQRSGLQRVPGCSGTTSKWSGIDFCYDPDNGSNNNNDDSSGGSGGFRLRLYWEDGYYWQESSSERKYCMQCDGSSCGTGDKVLIQTCGSGNTKLEFYQKSGTEASLRDTQSKLCMRVESNNGIRMRSCDSGDSKQRFQGSFSSSKFEIQPKGDSSKCVTIQHHPRTGEDLRLFDCSTARGDDTSYWKKY
jgi:hypothetical protein